MDNISSVKVLVRPGFDQVIIYLGSESLEATVQAGKGALLAELLLPSDDCIESLGPDGEYSRAVALPTIVDGTPQGL
jgi:hypothetical protein